MGSLFLFFAGRHAQFCRVLGQLARGTPTTTYGMHALHTSAQLAVDTIELHTLVDTNNTGACFMKFVCEICTVFYFFRGNQTHFRVTTATLFDVGDRITYYLYTRQPSLEKYQISNNMVPPPHFQKIRTINM